MEPMIIALVVLVVIGAFILGVTVSWLAKGYVEDYVENAAYARAVIHPEMLDEHGNMIHDEYLYLRRENDFETDDELYMNIDYRDGNDVFLSADFDGGSYSRNRAGAEEIEMAGGTFPLAWTRSYGSGKVFVTLLGHDGKSHQNHGFQKLVLNGVDWATS